MSVNIHHKSASLFQFLETSKSKTKPQNNLGNNGDFNAHMKNMEAKSHRRQVDNVDISRNHGNTKSHVYEPPRNDGNTVNQQPPVTEEARAEEAIGSDMAEQIAQALALIDEGHSSFHLSTALHNIASSYSLERGETTLAARGYEDTFYDLAKAYNQVYEYLKIYCEEKGYDETVFDKHLSTLNTALGGTFEMNIVRNADLAFRRFECGALVQPEDPAIPYIEAESVWRLGHPDIFSDAARNHSGIFFNKFLEVFPEEGYETAMAAAREALMNMPTTTSTSDISFKDLSIIVNTSKKGGFDDLNSLRNSDLSDFMKEDLEADWLVKQQLEAEFKKKRDELNEIIETLLDQIRNLADSALSDGEKAAQEKVIREQIQAYCDEFDKTARLPGANYRYEGLWFGGHRKAEETPAEALDRPQNAEGSRGGKGGRLSEVSLRDPWPTDHPLRAQCDRFLEIFKETYHEVLAEMGLAPETDDFLSVVMSNRDFKEMARRMVEKLNANPEAKALMAALNVDFSDDLPKKGKAETFNEEASRLIFEMWRKKHQDAAKTVENESRIDFRDFYKPKNQPARNIELLDFWQNAKPKERQKAER